MSPMSRPEPKTIFAAQGSQIRHEGGTVDKRLDIGDMAAARSSRHVSGRLPTAEHAGRRDASGPDGRARQRFTPGAIGPQPPSYTRRSRYEAVFGSTNRGYGGSLAAGPHSGLFSSSSSSSASSGSTSTAGAATTGKAYKLSFIQGVAGDGFYVTMGCGMLAEAEKYPNVTVNIHGPSQFDPTLQNPIIESVTASHPSAIMIAPDDVTASRLPRPGHERGYQGRSRRHHA